MSKETAETKPTCLFCEFSSNPRQKIWENDLFYAIFDAVPVSPGHAEIIPKRHVVDLHELNEEEWVGLKNAIDEIKKLVLVTDLKPIYESFLASPPLETSSWYCRKALAHPGLNTRPDGYNYGINDGAAAGRTVNHLHLHIIPRYKGDMADPRGGVRYVIPEMGNYKVRKD